MTCKDCVHYEACKYTAYECEGDYAADAFIDECCMAYANACPIFCDKSCWLLKDEAEKEVERIKNENQKENNNKS